MCVILHSNRALTYVKNVTALKFKSQDYYPSILEHDYSLIFIILCNGHYQEDSYPQIKGCIVYGWDEHTFKDEIVEERVDICDVGDKVFYCHQCVHVF